MMNEASSSMRQKRVMPPRSRRGGPGIGSTETDMLILDTQRRKSEGEPLIPATTKFLLTTNSSYIPASSSSSTPFELNSHAYERYFDRPEVLASFKAQHTIETPEYKSLNDSVVGGRFRPRLNNEGDIADTSDAAYEKRHRKYEMAEKRVRLREKEKLKHDQYKLKERIEQLRVMDGAAFLALPASQFSLVPANTSAESIAGASDDPDADDIAASHPNGVAGYREGERRRTEMLEVAMELEERYRTLLPPDRRYLERMKTAAELADGVTPQDSEELPVEDGLHNLNLDEVTPEPPIKPLKVKLKIPPQKSIAPAVTTSGVGRRKRRGSSLSAAKGSHRHSIEAHINSFPVDESQTNGTPAIPPTALTEDASANGQKKPGKRPYKRRKGVVAEPAPEDVDMAPPNDGADTPSHDAEHAPLHKTYESISAPVMARHKSVIRAQSAAFSHRASPKPTNLEKTSSTLRTAAMRLASAPMGRAARHITAFGIKTPDTLEDVREFDLPHWVRFSEVDEEEEARFQAGYRGPSPSETPGLDPAVSQDDDTLAAHNEDTKTKSEESEDEDTKDDDPVINGGDDEMETGADGTSSEEVVAASALLQL
ncbi:hypothetical protein HWV62_20116 [Athelia sp. TMB]|nr:hypothetical protein HWV62_31791 [Athelia sp. TMB]KAF7971678.1 hypothetical protein HWV62_20116 [Athelia sp. TMB]